MQVIYGTDINVNVADNVDPEDVMETLRGNYSELSNGSYTINEEDGSSVMRVKLESGSKAIV